MNPPDRARSLSRWRTGLAIAAVVLPLGLYSLFERQARRLDVLAEEGAPVEALVTGVSRDGGTTYYAYLVDGAEFTWSVARDEAPHAPGETFTATYSPGDPALSRPFSDRSLAAEESTHVRGFALKTVLGMAWFLGVFAVITHLQLRRARAGAPPETSDPAAFWRRLGMVGAAIVPMLILIFGFHAQNALEQGQSIVPVVLGIVLVLALIGGLMFYLVRRGPEEVRSRSAKLMRWIAHIAVGVALLRLLALVLGG